MITVIPNDKFKWKNKIQHGDSFWLLTDYPGVMTVEKGWYNWYCILCTYDFGNNFTS